MQSLDEQLTKYKEQLSSKDREISLLKSQLTNTIEHQQQQTTSKTQQTQRQTQNDNWNKEVRNLDARISDVLGKIKERELMLNNYDEWERKCKDLEKKYDQKNNEIVELNKKLNEKTNENESLKQRINSEQLKQQQQQQRKISLHDFDDDLGKVLMSKEEVITQLEKTIEDKDKQIYKLNDDIQQQNLKYQDECKRNQIAVNETIQHYSNKLSNTEFEFVQLSNELNRLNAYIDQQDARISELTKTKYDLEVKVNTINDTSRNEIENLQEEVKTFEYKLAHSQKELCDYKNLLNSIDLSAATSDKVAKLEHELNESKNENNYLNEHIYALDEFIRDKEAQNDLYENDIANLKCLNQTLTNEKQELEHEFNNNFILNYFNNNKNELVKDFCIRLNALSYHLSRIYEISQVKQIDFNNDQIIIDIFSKPIGDIKTKHQYLETTAASKLRKLNIKKFKVYLNELKQTIKSLEKFYASDINKYNQHVLTYITEQIVHKATLNGHLKFACELLRKKCTDSLILIPNVPTTTSSNINSNNNNATTTSSSTPIGSTSCSQVNTFGSTNNQITTILNNSSASAACNMLEFNNLSRDEKICKIASELLLCDEDSLRK